MKTRIIELPSVPATAERTDTYIPLLEVAPFAAMCPRCNDVRYQHEYTPRSLSRLLGRERAIEAHCVVCREVWPISAEERRVLAERLLSAHGESVVSGTRLR
jgi:hypothetical protein